MADRVVVTGKGVFSPFGRGVGALFDGMMAGESKVAPLEEPRASLRPGYGASLGEPSARALRDLPNTRDMRPGTMTQYTYLSTVALGDAMIDAKVPLETDGKDQVPPWDGARRRGAFIASYTNSDRFDKYVRFAHHVSATGPAGPWIDDTRVPDAIKKFTAFEFLKLMNNMPNAHAGIMARLQGPVNTYLGTPAGGLQALGRAMEAIRDGLADTMYTGGVGSSVHAQMMMVRATRGLQSSSEAAPAQAGRPFDRGATGIVPGEAGGVLVLERESTARARGATPIAELAGWADWFVPPRGNRELPPTGLGVTRAAQKALQMAGLSARDVDLVTAMGESAVDADTLEAEGLAELLGGRAADVPVLSLTAHVGALEAAVGPVSAAVALETMLRSVVPPDLNREAPIPSYRGPVRSTSTRGPIRVALVTVGTREGVGAAAVFRALG